MDATTLDRLAAELRPRLCGRYLGRARGVGPHAVAFEVSASRDRRLWLDAGRQTAGFYWLARDEVRFLEEPDDEAWPGRARQALLLLRKHAEGTRLSDLTRIPGERTVLVHAGPVLLVLRVSGPSPSLALVVDGRLLATLGDGQAAWPLPPPAPEREWDRVGAEALAAAAAGADDPRTGRRAVLAACPPLGPRLAGRIAARPDEAATLLRELHSPRPTVLLTADSEPCHDSDLVAPGAVALSPLPIEGVRCLHPATWTEAAATFLRLRRRGARFEKERRVALTGAQRDVRRLVQLESHLARDLAGLADPDLLRRRGEALLAAPGAAPAGASEAQVPDPYEPGRRLRIPLDPGLTVPGNAERLFQKARRVERARTSIEARLAQTREALQDARASEGRALGARDLSDLGLRNARPGRPSRKDGGGGPRRYLTSRGLSILVGRGARQNHELTFGLARPEDLWLHARDAPGAHVILRDDEGRAGPDDLREAAEVAAFYSDARNEAKVDVHVTRRKHLRPARGGPGRVLVGHSDTLRVAPRDPEGRLRRR